MIFLDASTVAELSSYAGLLKAITRWLEREDLADMAPSFVRLAEARFNRLIRSPLRETTVTMEAGGSATLPADFDGARHVYAIGSPNRGVSQVSPSELHQRVRSPAEATVFALVGRKMLFDPAPNENTSISLTYSANIPHLSDDLATNWLLTNHPDVYLFGALLQAEFYGWNDERLGLIKSSVDETIAEINQQANRQKYGASPLVMRSPDAAYGWR